MISRHTAAFIQRVVVFSCPRAITLSSAKSRSFHHQALFSSSSLHPASTLDIKPSPGAATAILPPRSICPPALPPLSSDSSLTVSRHLIHIEELLHALKKNRSQRLKLENKLNSIEEGDDHGERAQREKRDQMQRNQHTAMATTPEFEETLKAFHQNLNEFNELMQKSESETLWLARETSQTFLQIMIYLIVTQMSERRHDLLDKKEAMRAVISCIDFDQAAELTGFSSEVPATAPSSIAPVSVESKLLAQEILAQLNVNVTSFRVLALKLHFDMRQLQDASWNVTRASKILGHHALRTTLRLVRHALQKQEQKLGERVSDFASHMDTSTELKDMFPDDEACINSLRHLAYEIYSIACLKYTVAHVHATCLGSFERDVELPASNVLFKITDLARAAIGSTDLQPPNREELMDSPSLSDTVKDDVEDEGTLRQSRMIRKNEQKQRIASDLLKDKIQAHDVANVDRLIVGHLAQLVLVPLLTTVQEDAGDE